MTYTYLPATTDIGKVRLLIPDRVEADAIFTDEDLAVLLTVETGVKRAAAQALEIIASDQALLLKVQTTGQLKNDGKALAEALLARAKTLRGQASDDDDATGGAFDIAEWVTDDFSARERIYKQAQRRGWG
jgi:hypothetical protein